MNYFIEKKESIRNRFRHILLRAFKLLNTAFLLYCSLDPTRVSGSEPLTKKNLSIPIIDEAKDKNQKSVEWRNSYSKISDCQNKRNPKFELAELYQDDFHSDNLNVKINPYPWSSDKIPKGNTNLDMLKTQMLINSFVEKDHTKNKFINPPEILVKVSNVLNCHVDNRGQDTKDLFNFDTKIMYSSGTAMTSKVFSFKTNGQSKMVGDFKKVTENISKLVRNSSSKIKFNHSLIKRCKQKVVCAQCATHVDEIGDEDTRQLNKLLSNKQYKKYRRKLQTIIKKNTFKNTLGDKVPMFSISKRVSIYVCAEKNDEKWNSEIDDNWKQVFLNIIWRNKSLLNEVKDEQIECINSPTLQKEHQCIWNNIPLKKKISLKQRGIFNSDNTTKYFEANATPCQDSSRGRLATIYSTLPKHATPEERYDMTVKELHNRGLEVQWMKDAAINVSMEVREDNDGSDHVDFAMFSNHLDASFQKKTLPKPSDECDQNSNMPTIIHEAVHMYIKNAEFNKDPKITQLIQNGVNYYKDKMVKEYQGKNEEKEKKLLLSKDPYRVTNEALGTYAETLSSNFIQTEKGLQYSLDFITNPPKGIKINQLKKKVRNLLKDAVNNYNERLQVPSFGYERRYWLGAVRKKNKYFSTAPMPTYLKSIITKDLFKGSIGQTLKETPMLKHLYDKIEKKLKKLGSEDQ